MSNFPTAVGKFEQWLLTFFGVLIFVGELFLIQYYNFASAELAIEQKTATRIEQIYKMPNVVFRMRTDSLRTENINRNIGALNGRNERVLRDASRPASTINPFNESIDRKDSTIQVIAISQQAFLDSIVAPIYQKGEEEKRALSQTSIWGNVSGMSLYLIMPGLAFCLAWLAGKQGSERLFHFKKVSLSQSKYLLLMSYFAQAGASYFSFESLAIKFQNSTLAGAYAIIIFFCTPAYFSSLSRRLGKKVSPKVEEEIADDLEDYEAALQRVALAKINGAYQYGMQEQICRVFAKRPGTVYKAIESRRKRLERDKILQEALKVNGMEVLAVIPTANGKAH